MYMTINDIIGEKTIDLSYPFKNSNPKKEIALMSMVSDNTQCEIKDL